MNIILNFIKEAEHKVVYVGHFTNKKEIENKSKTDLEKLVENNNFGYWMRTGNKSTNDGTVKDMKKYFIKLK